MYLLLVLLMIILWVDHLLEVILVIWNENWLILIHRRIKWLLIVVWLPHLHDRRYLMIHVLSHIMLPQIKLLLWNMYDIVLLQHGLKYHLLWNLIELVFLHFAYLWFLRLILQALKINRTFLGIHKHRVIDIWFV